MKKFLFILILLPILANAQYFDVFDIDTSEYPMMKAKFYSLDDDGKQILGHTPNDFEITENGIPRNAIKVNCPNPDEDKLYSIVLSYDISSSMEGQEIELGRLTADKIISFFGNNENEFSLQQCNDKASILSDFTKDKMEIKSLIKGIRAEGENDFSEQLLNPKTGLLEIAKSGVGKKIAIIYTDAYWAPLTEFEIKRAISICKNYSISLYTVIYSSPEAKPEGIKSSLEEVSIASEGGFYDGVIDTNTAIKTANRIIADIKKSPCDITWESQISCFKNIELIVKDNITSISSISQLKLLDSQISDFEFSHTFINFGKLNKGDTKDTIITITAENYDNVISNILFEPNSNFFEVLTPLPIVIPKDSRVEITIRYTAQDTTSQYSKMRLLTEYCEKTFGLLGGDNRQSIANKTLELSHPIGGEIFIAGTDTNITWKGISKQEKVEIKFTTNQGRTWTDVSDSAVNLEYNWKVPNVMSDSCLIIIDQYTLEESREGEIEWSKTFGGNNVDRAASVVKSGDGGYIVVGFSASAPNNALLLKLDSDGETIWTKNLGANSDEYFHCISNTDDSGFIICGNSIINGDKDGWVVKLDSDGETEWEKVYGGGLIDLFYAIEQTTDGGYIVAGHTSSTDRDLSFTNGQQDAWVMKLDANGDKVWSKNYGGVNADYANSVIQSLDGGYVVVGRSYSNDGDIGQNRGLEDIYIMKLDPDGEKDWLKTFGGSFGDNATDVIQTFDGGFIITGGSCSTDGDFLDINDGSCNTFVIKTDLNGNKEWAKTYGGPKNDHANSVLQTYDGGFILAGNIFTLPRTQNAHRTDMWILKINNWGEFEWSNNYGGSLDDGSYSIVESNDGGYVLAGFSDSDDGDLEELGNMGRRDAWVIKVAGPKQPIQSDTSDAMFSIIQPKLNIINTDIDLGEMIVGNTKDSLVTAVFCNTTDAPLHVLGIDISGVHSGDFIMTNDEGHFFLKKDECRDILFEFTPSALGNRTALATIKTTIGDFKDTIKIRGEGINPLIDADTEIVDFGILELGVSKDTTVILLKNTGTADITITDSKIIGPDTEQFTLKSTPANFNIPVGEDKPIALNFTSRYGGKTSSILEFHYDGIGSPLRSMLFAEGIGGEIHPQIIDAHVGETVELGLFFRNVKPIGLSAVAASYTATVSYNSSVLAPVNKSMNVTTVDSLSYLRIEGIVKSIFQQASIPMIVGLGNTDKTGIIITEFQLYDAVGDSIDYQIELGVTEFNVLGICEEGGQRLLNPDSEATLLKLLPNRTSGQTIVEMTLIESGQTELTIFDQVGNKIETIYSGNPDIGIQEITLDLSNYSNGRYYIKLTTPTITKTEILEVVR